MGLARRLRVNARLWLVTVITITRHGNLVKKRLLHYSLL